MLKDFREESEAGVLVADLMERVFEDSGYLDSLRAGGPKEQSAVENVEELINSAARFDSGSDEPRLVDYLQAIALYSDADAFDPESGKVSLMTLHAAKGLEFENVFIVGLEQNILPHERSMGNPEEMEEERRLFFVGITRAKDHLDVSYARHRTVYGQFLRSMASEFLFEIGHREQDDFGEFSQCGQESDDFDAFADLQEDERGGGKGGFAINEFVRHKKFGSGRVKEFLDIGENSIVVVRFNSGKTKSLMVKYAKLERS
jgi:DNA helicase-2/ATP-dependent DNA helicase PcrA